MKKTQMNDVCFSSDCKSLSHVFMRTLSHQKPVFSQHHPPSVLFVCITRSAFSADEDDDDDGVGSRLFDACKRKPQQTRKKAGE